MFPEIPRFEGYYKSQSEGRHPFDDKKYDMPEDTREDRQKRIDSEEYFEEMYNRELAGRLLGGKLTPRQFAVMFGGSSDECKSILQF